MFSTEYIKKVRETASNYDSLSSQLFLLAQKQEAMPSYNPHQELYSLARISEQTSISLRNLAARSESGAAQMSPLYKEINTAVGTSVTEEHDWLRITMPGILPKRNSRDNSAFLTRPLRSCLAEFQRGSPIERFRTCVICIVHQYDIALGTLRIRDYDNIETKRYLDVIESIFLTNDSGCMCTILQTTQIGEKDQTVFYIMTPDRLPEWVKSHVNSGRDA